MFCSYLVFFDDGYAAYCSTSEVRLISYIGAGANTWAEVHPDNQKFIKHYIRNYPEFKMARLRESQLVSVEWNGNFLKHPNNVNRFVTLSVMISLGLCQRFLVDCQGKECGLFDGKIRADRKRYPV